MAGQTVRALELLAALWIEGRLERAEIKENSSKVEMTRLRSLAKVHGERPVVELDRRTLLAWQASIGRKAPATRKAYLCTVKLFCAWLHAEGHLRDDPAAELARPRLPRQKPRALPGGDVGCVFGACRDARERLIVWLEVGCGLRALEVSRLDYDDYDPNDRTLFVRGKFGHERYVPAPDEVVDAIEAYLAVRGYRQGPLVRAVDSNHQDPEGRVSPARLSKLVALRMAAAGVHRSAWDRKTGHALRHTCARDVLDRCRDLPVVQEMLGHRSLATTGIYLGIVDLGRLRSAMEGRNYRGRSPTVVEFGGDRLRWAPSSGMRVPDAGSPTGPADRESA